MDNNSFIEAAIQLVRDKFPPEWLRRFDLHKPLAEIKDFTSRVDDFKGYLIEVEDSIFDKLNLSILCGDYAGQDDFQDRLRDLGNLLKSIPVSDLEESIQEEVLKALYDNFVTPITLCIELYVRFLKSISRKYDLANREYFINEQNAILDLLDNRRYDPNSNANVGLFDGNLHVAHYDHFLTTAEKDLNQLLKINRNLTKLNVRPYSHMIISKCEFLIAKLILRKKKESNVPVYYIRDSEEAPLAVEGWVRPFFAELIRDLKVHYGLTTDWKESVRADFEILRKSKIENLNIKQLHRLILYIKDVSPLGIGLSEIRKHISSLYESSFSSGKKFDRYAFAVCLNYSINNEFSKICEVGTTPPAQLYEFYQNILKIQELTGVKNFFPQTRFLKFLVERLTALIQKGTALETIEPCKELFELCDKVSSAYQANIDWSRKNYNYIYQLPYELCFVRTDDSYVPNLFISSTFFMPLPEAKYVDEYHQHQRDVRVLKSSVDVLVNIEKELAKSRTVTEGLKKTELRTVELVSVFAALITFVAGSIQLFDIVNTVMEALVFMLALSSSLAIFVLVMLSLFNSEKIKERRGLFVAIAVIGLISWLGAVTYCDLPASEVQTTMDSVHQVNISSRGDRTLKNAMRKEDTSKPLK